MLKVDLLFAESSGNIEFGYLKLNEKRIIEVLWRIVVGPMKLFISFGAFSLKYTIIIILFTCVNLYKIFIVNKHCNNYNKSALFQVLLFYTGYILCFIPLMFSKNNSKKINNKLEETNKAFITLIYDNPYQLYLKKKKIFV